MVTIETERLILRGFQEYDAEDVYEYAQDPCVGEGAGWRPHGSVEESRAAIRDILSVGGMFAVEVKETGKVIGSAGYVRHGDELSNEIGYALSPQYWGRGLATEAVETVVGYGFRELGLKEIWCAFYEENASSRRVAEKCGFKYVLTQTLTDEENRERVMQMYVLLREDWERGERANG